MQRIKGPRRYTYTDPATGAKIEEDEEAYEEEFSDSDEPPAAGGEGEEEEERRGPSTSSGNPLVDLISNPEVIRISSTLIAKLEHVRYDETRKGVFKTKWGRDLFHTAARGLTEDMATFDIDKWYYKALKGSSAKDPDTRINPMLHTQKIDTNWLLELFKIEKKAPNFMKVLHNMLDLEDETHRKLGRAAKSQAEYDWYSEGPQNLALFGRVPAIEGPAAAPRPLISDAKK